MSEMEIVEDSTSNVVSNIPSSSGLSISVHPLVLLNISDHYTRTKLQNPEVIENGRMYGALLASQTGREVDIVNTFELPLSHADNNTTVLDKSFLTYKLDQRNAHLHLYLIKQVFPQLDFMGWYSIGSVPTEADLQLHEQFLKVNESSLFLQMNPILSNREFPIDIYESIIDIHQGRSVFVKSTYKTETEEAERIAVDHVAKPSSTSTTDTTSLGSTCKYYSF
ncbi:MAG: hypothetical protein EXX96DRAFT_475803 [Benjaminiella poitrasii]|nr:MAG: hypothetical protein EXX96DRAFT_475803 [Benjaminiella poitrasii]